MSAPVLPATKLDDARDALYAALQAVWVAVGWPAERAHRLPPGGATVAVPAAWVDMPVLHQAPSQNVRGMAATFPLVFVTDGSSDAQVAMQDRLLAYGWHTLDRVKVGGHRVILQTFQPEQVETGTAAARGLVLRVQVTLRTETLCQQPLVQETDEGTAP